MFSESLFRGVIANLLSSREAFDFFKDRFDNGSLNSATDVENLLSKFTEYLKSEGKWTQEIEFSLKVFTEQSNELAAQQSASPIFLINQSRKINDTWIEAFQIDFEKCKTQDRFVEELIPRRYKTITESVILQGVDGKKLLRVYEKYFEFNHPLVNYMVSSTLYNSKNYSQGLPILKKSIESIASYPHYYWDTEHGVEGAAWSIADLLHIVGPKGFKELDLEGEKYKLLKLLFLYLSRYIYMTRSNIKSIDFYSNRARVVKGYFMEFVAIFGIGVNPDIQYISDMYLAYDVAMRNNLAAIPSFMQFMWDSLKMYRHGSHIPNNSGGYQEIEDRTWMELIRDGETRSISIANRLFIDFQTYNLNIPKSSINTIFNYAMSTNPDNAENYLSKTSKRRLS